MKKTFVKLQGPIAITTALALSTVLTACMYGSSGSNETNNTYQQNGMMKMQDKQDGDTAVPADYRSWPKFVKTVDKVKTAQVRELYINQAGMKTQRGDDFPSGTISVMELYDAQKTADGKAVMDKNGRLIKSKLSKIFIMEKGEGWKSKQPAGTIDNGDWIYSAYLADGKTPATSDFAACRTCHLPLADDDYVARYDEHFDVYKR
ncbi:cytochrome P460 family protein [Leucothrix pacifica]|uniref:Cytochrome P460 domain-containing protein n=1 Tax=Leucothrix pacifica TaxID=1247513 RepID=A0A317CAC7_9GAMM|nr:cytochrome P460 family protein [Leucothrix pacifica]PWQ95498.1 hypothetical protein DKW60_14890 [Leucothrix pacifica]